MKASLNVLFLAVVGLILISATTNAQAGGYFGGSKAFVQDTFAAPLNDLDDGYSAFFGWHIVPQTGARPKISAEIEYTALGDRGTTLQTDEFGQHDYALVFPSKGDKYALTKYYRPNPELIEINPEDVATNVNIDGQMMTAWLRTQWKLVSVGKNNINLDARAGVTVAQAEIDVSNAYGYGSFSSTGVGPAAGIGLSADITSHLGAFVRYEKHQIDVAVLDDKVDLDPELVKVGLEWQF